MRVEGKGLEVNLELSKQVPREVQKQTSLEGVKKDIERRAKESTQEVSVSKEELQRMLKEIARKLDYLSKYLRIDIDDQLEIPVVKILEKDTNRLIRQIPPDYLLELMKRIDEMLGVLINERV